jgi:DNA-binding IscR family transcriptional regulator
MVVEGPIYLNKCLVRDGYCSRDNVCTVHGVWHKAKEALERILKQATLAELLRQSEVKKSE